MKTSLSDQLSLLEENTQKWQNSQQTDTVTSSSQSTAYYPKAPGNPKVSHISYNVTHISKSPVFQWDGNGGAPNTSVGITVLVLATELKLPN